MKTLRLDAATGKQTIVDVAVVAQPLPVPEMVTMFQARAALIRMGLFEAVDAHCKAAGGETLQAWEYANHAYRDGALITSLAPAFNLTAEQVDDLFRTAEGIEA